MLDGPDLYTTFLNRPDLLGDDLPFQFRRQSDDAAGVGGQDAQRRLFSFSSRSERTDEPRLTN
jgi:hypothetical protein